MKIRIKKISSLLSIGVLAVVTNNAWAAGTTAGVVIANTASISYKVGGAVQEAIESSEVGNSQSGVGNGTSTDFVVDKKVDLSVTGASDVNVVPNTTGNNLVFSVTNEGNSAEDFSFSIDSTVGGEFDATNCTATPSTIANLAVDTPTNVVVSCSIPNGGDAANGGVAGAGSVTDKDTSVVDLLATVTGVTETTVPDVAGTEDTVFADGTGTATDGADRNAKHSATGKYIVNTADIIVTKTSDVVKMVVNGVEVSKANGAKRIPGATVEYTIVVRNAVGASAPATGIVISDVVSDDLEYVDCSVAGNGIATCSESGGTVSSGAFDLAAGEIASLKFTATVK